jgi:NMD protein affecting ribosome stability and mRNA decay
MPKKMCPKCGASDAEFIGTFCTPCFIKQHELYALPKQLELRECPGCGHFFLKGVWVQASSKDFDQFIVSKIKSAYPLQVTDLRFEDHGKKTRALFTMTISVEGTKIERKGCIDFAVNRNQCRNCSLSSGGYHEMILQVRGKPEKVLQFVENFKRKLGSETFINAQNELKEGIDLQIGERRPALAVLSKMRVDYTHANKLVGRRDGKNLFRTSICVRLE